MGGLMTIGMKSWNANITSILGVSMLIQTRKTHKHFKYVDILKLCLIWNKEFKSNPIHVFQLFQAAHELHLTLSIPLLSPIISIFQEGTNSWKHKDLQTYFTSHITFKLNKKCTISIHLLSQTFRVWDSNPKSYYLLVTWPKHVHTCYSGTCKRMYHWYKTV